MEGWWHMDCHTGACTGQTVPPRDFPVEYSFLWQTATTHIALSSGLSIAPKTRHPNANCHRLASNKPG